MRPLTFAQAAALYGRDEIGKLSQSEEGVRFLLLRSLSRNEHMQELAEHHGIGLQGIGARDLLRHLYDADLTTEQIEASINRLFEVERNERRENEPALIAELYKMNEFYWGGLHQNSLERR